MWSRAYGVTINYWDTSKGLQRREKNIPFHRIVYANGTIWINDEYKAKRMKLYKKEGIEVDAKGKIKNFEEIVFEFL